MISHKDFLISYDIARIYGTRVEFKLNHMSVYLLEFLDEHPLFITRNGVTIKYFGSRLILEPRDCPSGIPQGIILPRLLVEPPNLERTSERSNRFTVDLLPRPDIVRSKIKLLPASDTNRGEWSISQLKFSDAISLRNEGEASEYITGICRAMLDLVQEFLDTTSKKPNNAITLLIKNGGRYV